MLKQPLIEQTSDSGPELILEAGRADQNYWSDLWRYRELFHVLAWRDVSVRYKQTVIGIGWALIRPLLTVLIFTFVFGRVAKLSSEGTAPYALLVFAGMLPWAFFSGAISEASNSLITNANLISKVLLSTADRARLDLDGFASGFFDQSRLPSGHHGVVRMDAELADRAVTAFHSDGHRR